MGKQETTADFARHIIKVHMAFRQFIQTRFKQQDIDLTFEMLQVMARLWNDDGINQQEIANATVKDKASMTYLIDNLVKRELVFRKEDDDDRRNKLVFLTPQGKALKETIQPVINEMYDLAGKNIPVLTIQSFMGVINQVCDNLETIN